MVFFMLAVASDHLRDFKSEDVVLFQKSIYYTFDVNNFATLILASDHVIFKVSWSDQFWKQTVKLKCYVKCLGYFKLSSYMIFLSNGIFFK